ncbi:MAG: phosphotransferase family protein [Porticoccaceae bacterium]
MINDRLTSRLLSSAVTALEKSVVPDIGSDGAATMLDIVIRTLRMLVAHYGHRAADLETLTADARQLLSDAGLPPPETQDFPGASPLERLEAESDSLTERLAEQIPSLLERATSTGGQDGDAVALLERIVSSQADFLATQDPDIRNGSGVVYRGGKIDRANRPAPVSDAPLNDDSLTAYLRARFPDSPGIRATSVNVLAGGFSKNTILFDLHRPGGAVEPCVMRKDMSADFLFMEKSVVDEYPLLEKVYQAGLNVATPLWLEREKHWFNGSFFISRAVPGTSDINKWMSNTGAVSRQLAEILAELHGYDLSAMSFPAEVAGLSAGAAIEQEILYWQNLYQKYRTCRHPLLEIGFAWTLANIPGELFERPGRILHGDVGFHNLMVKDGEISALLDWEFAHFGDPAEDLIYVRPFVEQIADWDAFIGHYRDAGGGGYSPAVERFYKVWSFVRNAAGTRHARYLFENHLPDEIKLALPAWIFGHYLELDASKMVLDILKQSRETRP